MASARSVWRWHIGRRLSSWTWRCPSESGADVLADLRGDPGTHSVAIVVVTGHPQLLTAAQLAETDGVLGKPFDVAELIETVHRAVQRAEHRQAEIAPVAATTHRQLAGRARRPTGVHRTRGGR